MHSAGAEAAAPGMDIQAEDLDLHFVEWSVDILHVGASHTHLRCRFKLHLRPERLDSSEIKRENLPRLPPGKTVVDVFADFLAYLFACARTYVCDTHANGESIWTSVEDRIEFVLSHPNGWEGLQQGKMRQAAVQGGLVPNTLAGDARVHFVTEGEASLNFCIQSGLTADTIHVRTVRLGPRPAHA